MSGGYSGGWKDCFAYYENNELPNQGVESTGTADDLEVLSKPYDNDDDYGTQFACTASCDSMVFEAVQGSTKIYVDAVVKVRLKPATFPEMPCPACLCGLA